MRSKIFRAVFLSTLIFLLLSLGAALWLAHSLMLKNEENILAVYTKGLVRDIKKYGLESVTSLNNEPFRLTIIAEDGTVCYDNRARPETMPNHADREEFIEAFIEGTSPIERYSDTLGVQTIYYAEKLNSGLVLRMALTNEDILSLTRSLLLFFLGIAIASGCIAAYISNKLSLSIINPINAIDFDKPLENEVYPEIAPFVRRIDMHQKQIEELIDRITKQSREIEAITNFMAEGLVLFNAGGIIISVNNRAKEIFNITEDCIGKNILSIDRSVTLRKYFDRGEELNQKIEDLERGERIYRVFFNKIQTVDSHVGYALFIIDVTQKRISERQRQEFTANVSHELKTPLQSIIGRAELMENNMVQAKDITNFAGRIRKEGENLLKLIDDIILLSRIEEGRAMENEEIDLSQVMASIKETLEDKCALNRVELSYTGQASKFYGVYRYFHQLLFNLCDNAVKYNNPGGHVWVTLGEDENNILMTVKDDGIGIPKTSHSRIYERFYLIDKSRNKKKVGTGLGLSIVKHIVLFYKGTIELDSDEGQGTAFSIRFPKANLSLEQSQGGGQLA